MPVNSTTLFDITDRVAVVTGDPPAGRGQPVAPLQTEVTYPPKIQLPNRPPKRVIPKGRLAIFRSARERRTTSVQICTWNDVRAPYARLPLDRSFRTDPFSIAASAKGLGEPMCRQTVGPLIACYGS